MISVSKTQDKVAVTYRDLVRRKNVSRIIPFDSSYAQLKDIERQFHRLEGLSYVSRYTELVTQIELILASKGYSSLLSSLTDELVIKGGETYLVHGDIVTSVPMPATIANWVKDRIDKQDDFVPIIKFWKRLLGNPNIHDKRQATLFAESVCQYITRTHVAADLKDQCMRQGYSEHEAAKLATVYQTPLTLEGIVQTKKVVCPT